MASIPHGTMLVAQGIAFPPIAGRPTIAPMGMTPFPVGQPTSLITFASQTASNGNTPRLPQNLGPFVAASTITQAILDDANTVLRNQIQHQTITETIVIAISTNPAAPLFHGPLPGGATPNAPPPAITPSFGGGPANIAFLQGLANPQSGQGPNAQTAQMDAVFWIETVTYQIAVPPIPAGTPSVILSPVAVPGATGLPTFFATLPFAPGKKFAGGTVMVSATQIQYAQKVVLNFVGLSWPHVSVATLVPADPLPIPASLLPLT